MWGLLSGHPRWIVPRHAPQRKPAWKRTSRGTGVTGARGRRREGDANTPTPAFAGERGPEANTHCLPGCSTCQQTSQRPSVAGGEAPEQARPWGWAPALPDCRACPLDAPGPTTSAPKTRLFCRHHGPGPSHPLTGPSLLPCLHVDGARGPAAIRS